MLMKIRILNRVLTPMSDVYNYLVFGDGTRIDNGSAAYANKDLWLYFKDMTMQEAAMIAFDKQKLETIDYVYGGHMRRYHGFTDCNVISQDEDGTTMIRLNGKNSSVEPEQKSIYPVTSPTV